MIVPFQIVGQIGANKSVQFSSEVMRNVYLSYSEANNRWGAHDFPGLKLVSAGSGVDRGDHVMAATRYLINGTTLFSETAAGARTSLGTIAGSDRAVFADDGTNLYIVANSTIYRWDGSAVSTVSQSVVSNPSSIAYINRQFIITGDNGLFGTSDVADGTTYNALNYAEAETQPDPLIRCYTFNQLAYMMGSQTIEPWYNSGVGNPPFDRQTAALINIGLIGKYAVTNSDQFMYWMADDRKIYQCVGSSARPINTSGVSYLLESFATVSDCIASCFILGGQTFVLFRFPSADAAFVYSEENQYWVELSAGTSIERSGWYGNAVTWCYDKNLVTDYRNGNTYELDFDTYTDNGDARLRIIVPRTFTGADAQLAGRRVTATGARLNMQTGVGLASGQGVNPVLMCQFSPEGGEVWQAQQLVEIGAMGDYVKAVDFWDFATGYAIKVRFMISDPVPFSAFDGYIDLIDAGY